MENDYLTHWGYSYPTTLIHQVEVDGTNVEGENSVQSISEIRNLEVVSLENGNILAPQNLPTASSSAQYEVEEYDESNSSESESSEEARGTLSLGVVDNSVINDDSQNVTNTSADKSTKSRRRSKNHSEWKKNVAKRAKNSGDAGVSLRGKEFQMKILGAGCCENCRFKCNSKINTEQRQNVFDAFWRLAGHTRQWDYIARLMVFGNTDEADKNDSNRKKRSKRQYTLPVAKDVIKVCRSMFIGTLGITEQWIHTVEQKAKTSCGTSITPDLRGRHSSRPSRIPEAVTQSVKDHIKMFSRVESHYCRQSTDAEYLEEGLNLASMYRLYRDWMNTRNEKTVASESHYRHIFNYSHNLRFHIPKKDQCDVCAHYEFSTGLNKDNAEEEYRRHQKNKTLVRKLKEDDKKEASDNLSSCVASFDLQKVLSTPKAETSVLFYRRKLSVYNFTIFDIGRREGFCYVWNETIAERGANEISSCLWRFITDVSKKGAEEIIFYSDNCGGQNRNRMVYATYALAEKWFNVKITHRFLEKGHTQSEGDSMHAAIEVASRHKPVYTQAQWCDIIKSAKKKTPLYTVLEMSQEDILRFSEVADKQNWKKGECGKAIQISKVKQISTVRNSDFVELKYDYEGEVQHVNLSKYTSAWRNHEPSKAYSHKLPLDMAKNKDLKYLCEKRLIPESAHSFYNSFL